MLCRSLLSRYGAFQKDQIPRKMRRARFHTQQNREIPHRVAVAIGNTKRPLSFLPRQPVEGDDSVFSEGTHALYDRRSAAGDAFEIDTNALRRYDEKQQQHQQDADDDAVDGDLTFVESGKNQKQRDSHPSDQHQQTIVASGKHFQHQHRQQIPIASLKSARLGLPVPLLDRLQSPPSLASWPPITHLTPVQAKLLQRAFLLHDCAVCAETGSGKSFGLCVALVAKLLRNGPTVPRSALFVAPTDVLVTQVARWLTDLWPYEIDKPRRWPRSTNIQAEAEAETEAGAGMKPEMKHTSLKNDDGDASAYVATIEEDDVAEEENSDERSSSSSSTGFRRRGCLLVALTSADYARAPWEAYRELSLRKPLIVVGSPAALWAYADFCQTRKEERLQIREDKKQQLVEREQSGEGKNALADFAMLGYRTRKKPKALMQALVLPGLDTLVVDEADVVLPFDEPAAPGNLLVAELTNPLRYRSPVHLLLNSATMSPASVSHIRRFLKKSMFASASAQIFDGDSRQGGGGGSGNKISLTADSNNNGGNSNDNGSSPVLHLPESIRHHFIAADSTEELESVIAQSLRQFSDEILASQQQHRGENNHDDVSRSNCNSKKNLNLKQRIMRALKNNATAATQHPTMPLPETKSSSSSSSDVLLVHDDDGYSTIASTSKQQTTDEARAPEKAENISIEGTSDDAPAASIDNNSTSCTSSSNNNNLKLLIIYPECFDNEWTDIDNAKAPPRTMDDGKDDVIESAAAAASTATKATLEAENDDAESCAATAAAAAAAAEEDSAVVRCAGNINSLAELCEIVLRLSAELSAATAPSSSPQSSESNNCPIDVCVRQIRNSSGLRSNHQVILRDYSSALFLRSSSASFSSSSSSTPLRRFDIVLIGAGNVRGYDDVRARVVLNLTRPASASDFVHWSGRVGRMGREGDAVHVMSRTWVRSYSEFCNRTLGADSFRLRHEIQF